MTRTVAPLLLAALLVVLGPGIGPSAVADEGAWPLDPRPPLAAGFDPPVEPWGAGHRGVDLVGDPGQPVHAAQDGTVTFAGMLAGRGVVVVGHGHTRTTYEPVDASVRAGDRVRAGERIGSLETFGSHCWPRTCLHWGLLEGRTYLNPLLLVGAGPVRLIPLYTLLTAPPASTAPVAPVAPVALAPRLAVTGPVPLTATEAAPHPAVGGVAEIRPGGVPAGRPGVVALW